MKVRWFSVWSVAGMVLLAGNSFGAELRWKNPAVSTSSASAVLCIPASISTSDELLPTIVQVQAVESERSTTVPPVISLPPVIIPPETLPPSAPLPTGVFDRNDPRITPTPNPPQGAAILNSNAPERDVILRDAPTQPHLQTTNQEQNLVLCDDTIKMRSIREISPNISPKIDGILPAECVIDEEPFYGRHFSLSCFHWKASALSTKAAYFEDVQLDRYGHTRFPALQPIISGTKFLATIPMLPYKMAVTPAGECIYTLGHYRTGNPSPYVREPLSRAPR